MLLCIRTDTAEAQFLLCDNSGAHIAEIKQELGRDMAKQILTCLEELLQRHNAEWSDTTGVIVFRGPGSFTGLRIGVTVANTIAYSLQIPIVGTSGEQWIRSGVTRLSAGENDLTALPYYSKNANITTPKK